MLKKIGSGISSFFKNHTIVAILLITVILLASVWTPVIIKLSGDKNQNNSQNTVTGSVPVSSGPSVFVVGGSEQSSTKNEVSSVESSNKAENVSSKNESEDKESSSSKVTSSKQEVTEKLKIICWGDSITQGMSVPQNKNYPAVLGSYLGDKYEVLNAGVPGESSYAIAARQGAIEVFTAREVVIKKGEFSGYLGKVEDTGICTADGINIDTDHRGYAFSCQLPATVIYIDGEKYKLSVRNEEFFISKYQRAEKDIIIKKGSKIEFNSSREQQKAYCEVILVGANDGLGGSPEDIKALTERYKKMAERRNNDKYLVIVPWWLGNLFDDVFVEAFGDKAINFRQIALTTGLQTIGIRQPSKDDEYAIKNGSIPPSLMLNNSTTDPLHLSENGYKLMGLLIYERGMKLKYW